MKTPTPKQVVYVTEWVVARGILKMWGTPASQKDTRRQWYHLDLPEQKYRRAIWALGTSVFLTLEEAQANALQRWEDYVSELNLRVAMAQRRLAQVQAGELQVHDATTVKVTTLKAFKDTP